MPFPVFFASPPKDTGENSFMLILLTFFSPPLYYKLCILLSFWRFCESPHFIEGGRKERISTWTGTGKKQPCLWTEENLQTARVPFLWPMARQREAADEGLICKPALRKDCTDTTSVKPARSPSSISQSGREGVENVLQHGRKVQSSSRWMQV